MKYALAIKTSDGVYLVADKNGTVRIQDFPGVLTKQLEQTFDHRDGSYERQVSVVLHKLQFQPTEVAVPDTAEEMIPMVEPERGLMRIGGVAGSYHGWLLKKEFADKMLPPGSPS